MNKKGQDFTTGLDYVIFAKIKNKFILNEFILNISIFH